MPNKWVDTFGVLKFVVVYLDDDGRQHVDNRSFATMQQAFAYAKTIASSRHPIVYKVCDPEEEIDHDD